MIPDIPPGDFLNSIIQMQKKRRLSRRPDSRYSSLGTKKHWLWFLVQRCCPQMSHPCLSGPLPSHPFPGSQTLAEERGNRRKKHLARCCPCALTSCNSSSVKQTCHHPTSQMRKVRLER